MPAYRERLPISETEWIIERLEARGDLYEDWARFLGLSKSMFSKILHQVRPLPERYEEKWGIMESTIRGDEPCVIIRQKKK